MKISMEHAIEDGSLIDREQVFLLYTTFCGDVERTAHAVDLRPVDILKMAEEQGWNEKLAAILKLKKSNRPGDVERGINRALNFTQCHRFRLFLERVMRKLAAMGDQEMEDYIFNEAAAKDGSIAKKLTTRALADLASAMEKCQAMSYQALSDTAQDRAKRDEAGHDGESGGQLHAQIAAAMAVVGKDTSPRAQLFDAQLEHASALKSQQLIPARYSD